MSIIRVRKYMDQWNCNNYSYMKQKGSNRDISEQSTQLCSAPQAGNYILSNKIFHNKNTLMRKMFFIIKRDEK